MTKYVYDYSGMTFLREEEAVPVCGEAFCEECGDCLYCYGDDECFRGGGSHLWVEYEEHP
jgi:hypothetical protein